MIYARAVARLALLAVMAAGVILLHLAFRLAGRRWAFPKSVYAFLCRVFGIRVRVEGRPERAGTRPKFYIANHLSYIDVLAIGSVIDGRFVAKSDVANWPLFGFLASIQNTVFIRRTRAALEGAKNVLAGVLKGGDSIVVFAEGTSSNGTSVLPFKPGLLDALRVPGVAADVQPLAVVLDRVGGRPVAADPALRDVYAWWRPETTLLPHLWGFACTPCVDVTLHFLPVLVSGAGTDRKALARAAQTAVAAKVEVAGRLD